MKIEVGIYTVTEGDAAGDVVRVADSAASAPAQKAEPIRAANAKLFARGAASGRVVVEVDRVHATKADARAFAFGHPFAAVNKSGSVKADGATIGTGTIEDVHLVEWNGVGTTMSYLIVIVQTT